MNLLNPKFWRNLGITLALFVGVAIISWPQYQKWKERRIIRQSRQFFYQGQLNQALISAHQVLSLNEKNLEAVRLIADILETGSSPQALIWRKRAWELDSKNKTNALAWAGSALKFGNIKSCAEALAQVPAEAKESVIFHEISGLLALRQIDPTKAENHFTRALKLDPANDAVLWHLAGLNLTSTNPALQAAAIENLEGLAQKPGSRSSSLRTLANYFFTVTNRSKALEVSTRLATSPTATFSDKVYHLTSLHLVSPGQVDPLVSTLQNEAILNADRSHELVGWMIRHGRAGQALAWYQTLGTNVSGDILLQMAVSDAFVELRDWPGLEVFLVKKSWGEKEYLRRATLARAYREQENLRASETEWEGAVRLAISNPMDLVTLGRLASNWKWDEQSESILWMLVKAFPEQQWPLEVLYEHYNENQNTPGLYRLFKVISENDSKSLVAKNNFALLCLLMGVEKGRSHQMAREVFQESPTNLVFACTYAFSQFLSGNTENAIKVLEDFPANQILQNPNTSLYFGYMLAQNSRKENARPYLQKAQSARMLPEEKFMLDDALDLLRR